MVRKQFLFLKQLQYQHSLYTCPVGYILTDFWVAANWNTAIKFSSWYLHGTFIFQSFNSTTVILTRLLQQFWICCHLLMPPLPPVHRLLFSYPSAWKMKIYILGVFFNIFHWLLYSEYARSYILKQELLTFHYGLLSSPFQYPSPEPEILQCNLQSAINTNQSTILIDSVLSLLDNLKYDNFLKVTCFTFYL